MKKPEKTNGSQALDSQDLDRGLFLAQPASDGDVTNGGVSGVIRSNPDELSALPTEFTGMYRACYEAGYASGKESGYRQGYRAGFGDGRGQDNGSPSAAAVENIAPEMRRARLFGLPCTKCGKWFFSDEARCPRCQTARVTSAEAASATRGD